MVNNPIINNASNYWTRKKTATNISLEIHVVLYIHVAPYLKFFSLINSCKSFNYSGLPSSSPLLPNLYLPISFTITILFRYFPLIYLFVSSSSISPKFPLFNHKYIYWKRVNSYWYGWPHLISDFDFIISVYMLYILCD